MAKHGKKGSRESGGKKVTKRRPLQNVGGKKSKDIYKYEDDEATKRTKQHRNADEDSESDAELGGDDESVDDDADDIGWNSDDELAFGDHFNSRKKAYDLESEDEDEDEYSNDNQEVAYEEAGEMLLSDMLGGFDQPSSSSSRRKAAKTQSQARHEDDDQNEIDIDDNEYDDDDEEEDDDDDDEEEDDDDDNGFDYGDDDDDDDDDDGDNEYSSSDDEEDSGHRNMLAAIEKFSNTDNKRLRKSRKVSDNQGAPDSAFSSLQDSGDVSMATLLGALGNNKNVKAVKAKMEDLQTNQSAPVFVEKTVSDRIERTLTYDKTKEEMGKWQDMVTVNRSSKTLDFAQDRRETKSYKSMVDKFKPETDLEKEINMVLISSNQTEKDIEKQEEDELKAREFDAEEIAAKQAELAKVRSLLFYDQMKRNRINKIKSKAYHRILKRRKQNVEKREKELLAETDPDALEELNEAEATRRIKERMTLKHKNTSRWAKMALQYGVGDKTLRDAYHESVALGQELTKKIDEIPSGSGNKQMQSDSEDSESDDDDDDDDNDGSRKKRKIARQAAKKIKETLQQQDDIDKESAATNGKYKKLLEMDFMKKAREIKQNQARQEAQDILKELEGMENDNSDTSSDSEGEKDVKKSNRNDADKKALRDAENSYSNMLDNSGSMTFKVSKNESETNQIPSKNTSSSSLAQASNPWLPGARQSKRNKSSNVEAEVLVKAPLTDSNMDDETSHSNKIKNISDLTTIVQKKKNREKLESKIISNGSVDKKLNDKSGGTNANDRKKNKSKNLQKEVDDIDEVERIEARKPVLVERTQEDLVQMAFAGPDLKQDFIDEKKRIIDAELGIDEKRREIEKNVKNGWGDWAGPGDTGVSDYTLRKRNRLMAKVEKESEEKCAGRKDKKMYNVMISEKQLKGSRMYRLDKLPHPFKTWEEYELSIRMPIGEEWNTSHVVMKNTKPEVITRAGRIIEAAKLPKKRPKADGRVFKPNK